MRDRRKGPITRREVLKLMAVGGGMLAVEACAPAAAPSPSATAAPTAAAATAAPSPVPGKPSQQLIDAAKAEGKGMLYAVTDPAFSTAMLAEFKKRYGIDVEFTRLTSGPLGQKYAAEADAGNVVADAIVITDIGFMEQAGTKGWLAEVKALTGFAEWPSDQRTDRTVSVALNPGGVCWNTTAVPDAQAPKKWEDLLDPKWQGKIMLIDPRQSVPTTEVLFLLRQAFGDDYLRKLGAQKPQLNASVVTAAQQVAAGAAALSFPSLIAAVAPLQAQKAPIQIGFPEPTTPAASLLGISAKAPHPNIAKLLFDFYLSRDGQAILNKGGWSPLAGIPDTRPLPKVIQPKGADVLAAREAIVKLLGL